MIQKIVIPVFALLFLMGCYYDKADVVAPVSLTNSITCDTSSVGYSKTVAPIIAQSCNSCHGNSYATDGQGIRLDSYNDLKSYITNSGNTFLNSIYHKIHHSELPNLRL